MSSLTKPALRRARAKWKLALIFALILAAGVLAVQYLAPDQAQNPTFLTAKLELAPIVSSVTSTGALNALVNVEVSSQISGQVAELFVDFNDTVKTGQPIARLDQSILSATLQEAEGELAAAQAQIPAQHAEIERMRGDLARAQALRKVLDARVEQAESELASAENEVKRLGTLRSKGGSTDRDLELADTARQTAAARLREAQAQILVHAHEVAVAEANLAKAEAGLLDAEAKVRIREAAAKKAAIEVERAVIRSPIDGVVIGRDIDRGQTVAASLEAPTLFTIARDLREMEVHALVDEADIGQIKPDQQAYFTVDAYPDRRFAARVAQIRKAPEVVESVVTYTVVLSTANDDLLLLPGMTALVEIIVASADSVLTAPNAALRYQPRQQLETGTGNRAESDRTEIQTRLWVLGEDGRPKAVPVETGVSGQRVTEIVSDTLREGQPVIIGEVAAPSDGDRRSSLRLRF